MWSRWKITKILSKYLGSTPIPLSRTANSTVRTSVRAETATGNIIATGRHGVSVGDREDSRMSRLAERPPAREAHPDVFPLFGTSRIRAWQPLKSRCHEHPAPGLVLLGEIRAPYPPGRLLHIGIEEPVLPAVAIVISGIDMLKNLMHPPHDRCSRPFR